MKMRKSKCKTNTIREYRRDARELMRIQYPNIDWKMYFVHHIDGNPFNNELPNLKIVYKQEHKLLHKAIKIVNENKSSDRFNISPNKKG